MNQLEWILSRDTGTSSQTIWAVMMGVISAPTPCLGKYDVPHDPDDFGRCYRLLRLFPAWEGRLQEVANLLPKWGPMVREWAKMKALYERDLPTGKSSELASLMRTLEDEGLLADGWTRIGPGSWVRGK